MEILSKQKQINTGITDVSIRQLNLPEVQPVIHMTLPSNEGSFSSNSGNHLVGISRGCEDETPILLKRFKFVWVFCDPESWISYCFFIQSTTSIARQTIVLY